MIEQEIRLERVVNVNVSFNKLSLQYTRKRVKTTQREMSYHFNSITKL